MPHLLWDSALAQAADPTQDFFRRMGRSMTREPAGIGLLVGIVLGLVAALILLRFWLLRRAARRERMLDDPAEVLHALAERHQLLRDEARVIDEAAAIEHLPDPAVLFVRPSVFDRCFEAYVKGVGDGDLRRRAQGEVEGLRRRLFGDLGRQNAREQEA